MSIIILGIIFIPIFAIKKVFYLTVMLYILLFIFLIIALYIIKKLIFINKAQFTYGKVIKVEKSNSKESDVYQNFVIEYTDKSINKSYKITVYEHFGDNDDELKSEIQYFYKKGQNLLGKKVPLLYIPNETKKTMAFIKKAE